LYHIGNVSYVGGGIIWEEWLGGTFR